MKIPDASASANLPYYGNEENGQWQPNGVIIDSGVGGGIVGSGDAGVHRAPVYPVHIPRGHVPGYVMAGAYYPPAYPAAPPPAPQDDFADYMWMENEEEFDKQVMQQLEEEALMEQCIEAMLEDQQREGQPTNGHNHPTTSNGTSSLSLEETVSRSTLNPLAAEFVPTRRPPPQPPAEDRVDAPDTQPAAERAVTEHTPDTTEEPGTAPSQPDSRKDSETDISETTPPPTDPPEVSAADVQPITDKILDKRPKEAKKDPKTRPQEARKTVKQDPKKVTKPAPIKSETKVQTPVKKKEVKQVKSDSKLQQQPDRAEERSVGEEVAVAVASAVDTVKQSTPPPQEEVTSGPKPINYAAAAKANKPKKPSTPPITETPLKPEKTTPVTVKPDKTKPATKTIKDKPVPRKNSTK